MVPSTREICRLHAQPIGFHTCFCAAVVVQMRREFVRSALQNPQRRFCHDRRWLNAAQQRGYVSDESFRPQRSQLTDVHLAVGEGFEAGASSRCDGGEGMVRAFVRVFSPQRGTRNSCSGHELFALLLALFRG